MAINEDELLRKIYFYRIGSWDDVRTGLAQDLQRIANLPWDQEGRYLRDLEGARLAIWPDQLEFPLRLRFGRTRMGNLPLKEQAGKLEHLQLAIDQGLVEMFHMVIYREGFAAADFNFSGPRVSRLSDYLFAKRNELDEKVVFHPLFQRDIVSLVERMPVVQWLEISGKPTASAILAQADQGLGQALKTLGEAGAEKAVRLGLGTERGHHSKLQQLALELAKVVTKQISYAKDELRVLRVKGVNERGKIDAVDLLEQHLVVFKVIERLSLESRALSPESAYLQIDAAHDELLDQLENAAMGTELFQ